MCLRHFRRQSPPASEWGGRRGAGGCLSPFFFPPRTQPAPFRCCVKEANPLPGVLTDFPGAPIPAFARCPGLRSLGLRGVRSCRSCAAKAHGKGPPGLGEKTFFSPRGWASSGDTGKFHASHSGGFVFSPGRAANTSGAPAAGREQ